MTPDIAFSWSGLPQYAARLIRTAIDQLYEECVVIGSRPNVPVEGMECALGQSIYWVDKSKPISWADMGMKTPGIFVQSGWAYPGFSSLGREVKREGGKVIGLSDANWRGDLRQILGGAVAFRIKYRRHFDAMLVPGKQGMRLMRWYGMPAERIRMGMYGADPALFSGGTDLSKRPKTLLFVGQLVARKDVLNLTSAFLRLAGSYPDWCLSIIGSGEQRDLLPTHPQIIVEDFIQPDALGSRFHDARFLVLPSLSEAWGLVAHEAALSGCGLVLSDRVGSGDDLCGTENGVRFKAGNTDDLERALSNVMSFSSEKLTKVETESRRLASQFGPQRFAAELIDLIDDLRYSNNR